MSLPAYVRLRAESIVVELRILAKTVIGGCALHKNTEHSNTASYEMGVLSPEVKRPELEDDHSPPSSAEVKNTWSYTSTPHASSRRGA
jgi:hypothetical protein